MRRGTIFIALFIIIAAGILGAAFLQALNNNDGDVQGALDALQGKKPPLILSIGVDPLIQGWIQEAVADFNAAQVTINNGKQQVVIEPFSQTGTTSASANTRTTASTTTSTVSEVPIPSTDDLSIWYQGEAYTNSHHPDLWIPASQVSIGYAASVPYVTVAPSLARTPLVIGGYQSRVDILTQNGTVAFDWPVIVEAAETESWAELGGESSWRFVNLGFSLADRTMSGLAVLYSAAGAFNQTTALQASDMRGDFQDWFEPVIRSVPNWNTIGADVTATMALGPSTIDIAFAPEVQWLNGINAILRNEPIILSYPEYGFVFDFPLALWDDDQTSDDQRTGAAAFADWLLEPAQQRAAGTFGLRPAAGSPATDAMLFNTAVRYGVLVDAPLNHVEPPISTATQGILSWFQRTR